MPQKIQGSQRDFSFGEVDANLKRADEHPARKGGLRQMSNCRILNSGALEMRSGRSAMFPAPPSARIEQITMSPGNEFKISFGAGQGTGQIQIYSSSGVQVASFTNQGSGLPLPWTLLNADAIVYAQLGLKIYITFPGMKPQQVTWDGVTTWTIADYAELSVGAQKRTPFYRISPQGITILPSAQTGNITVTASAPVFTPAHVGTRIRFVNRQILIAGYTSPTVVTATVQEPLPGSQSFNFATDPTLTYAVGDVVRGSVTGSAGVITSVTSSPAAISIQLISTNSSVTNIFDPTIGFAQTVFAFTSSDTIVGPGGGLAPSAVTPIQTCRATTYWDDEVINTMRGYPASCFVDQFRLGFCNFPSVPNGIAWSAINSPTDLYVGPNPADAMFELAPDKVQVFYVLAGPESSEFVFCDKKLYYIKIDASTPLKPGSVGFQTLSGDGCAQVQPRVTQEIILYVNAGRSTVLAIVASGAYYRPFNTKNLCEFHSHLFSDIRAIAVPTADGAFNERYAYVLNGDGSIIVGKYSLDVGQAPKVGWGPWSGVGAVRWVSAADADVLFTTTYFNLTTVCEILDETKYLDGTVFVNALPAPFAPAVGKGPLWWIASNSVSLMDQSTRSMGTYQVDGNGFIIPQGNAGEDLSAASLVAGQAWTSTVEPFCPNANSGADVGQRMKMRQITSFAVYVLQSTGFLLGHLFSSRQTRTSPPLGTLMNFRRFPAWNQDDDPTKPPPERETTEAYPTQGSSYDPRAVLIKDTPGPLQLLEIGIEVSL